MVDRFSILTTPAHLTEFEGDMIQTCQSTRGTEAEALRAVETPNWQQRSSTRDYFDRLWREINHSQELFCHGHGEYHPDEAFGVDNLEGTRRCRHKYCRQYRAAMYRFHRGNVDIIDEATRLRLIKGSKRRNHRTSE
jgi:hypothetical protein